MSSDLLSAPAAKTVALVPAAPETEATALVLMFERLAKDPAVDVEKLQRLIELQERILRYNAQSAFNVAFARMQAALPEITERGQILVKGQLRSTYAKLEDIHAAIKPILKAHGFAIRHRTEWPTDRPAGVIRIVGILSHEQGHSEESAFEAPADKSDYRTDIQSMGSTVSYGRRYTTLDLLNLTTRGIDDDGRGAGKAPAPPAPEGFDHWVTALESVADLGTTDLDEAWGKSSSQFKNYLLQHHAERRAAIKAKAQAANRSPR